MDHARESGSDIDQSAAADAAESAFASQDRPARRADARRSALGGAERVRLPTTCAAQSENCSTATWRRGHTFFPDAPGWKRCGLIDERDAYLAHKILETEGKKIVAVVGAGHVDGMKRQLESEDLPDMDEITSIPADGNFWKIVGWSIPLVIVGSIVAIALTQGTAAAGENALIWFLANAIPSGIGAMIALGHPVTIAAAALSAPFTSLTPLIGAGYVAAFAQLWARPPRVSDFRTVGEDFAIPSRWWKSRLMQIFLVFILTTLGSLIGTWTGGFGVIRNLVEGSAP